MSKAENPRAFPSAAIDDKFGGMTLRDWFTGQALVGIAASIDYAGGISERNAEYCAKAALLCADALLAQREEKL